MDLSWLKARHDFRTLVDIGANDGSYGTFLRGFFEIENVHAFEPLPVHSEGLRAKGFRTYQMALGDSAGEAAFTVNAYDAASSLLPLTTACKEEWPNVREERTIRVRVERLDDALEDLERDVLIKVDAQGAEDRIIAGGRRTFAGAAAVLIEMTFVPLYAGQQLFNEVHAQLANLGFVLRGFKSQHVSQRTGEPLFAHCIYERMA